MKKLAILFVVAALIVFSGCAQPEKKLRQRLRKLNP